LTGDLNEDGESETWLSGDRVMKIRCFAKARRRVELFAGLRGGPHG
jgi:hypothetical protein